MIKNGSNKFQTKFHQKVKYFYCVDDMHRWDSGHLNQFKPEVDKISGKFVSICYSFQFDPKNSDIRDFTNRKKFKIRQRQSKSQILIFKKIDMIIYI